MIHKATMADVARRAGVSPSTAARVIHANGYVSRENRELVLEAARAVGYRPNLAARILRTKRSNTLGLVLSEATSNPFFTTLGHAVQHAALEEGYTVLTFYHGYSGKAEREGVRRFLDYHVEAVLFCHASEPENVQLVRSAGIPAIQIERPRISGGPVALVDPLPGFLQAVERLAELGHRRIAFIGGSARAGRADGPGLNVDQQRVEAFRTAMRRSRLDPDASPVLAIPYDTGDAPLQGYHHAKALFSDTGPTAVIAGSDIIAAGILQAAYEAGRKVPGDISVVGYDNSIGAFLTPALSTIAQPADALAQAAVKIAMQFVAEPGREIPDEIRATSFIERASTGQSPDP